MSQGASVRLAGDGSLVQALPGSLEAQVNSSITANKFLGGETFRLFFFLLMNLEAEKMVTKAWCVMILL